MSKRQRIKCELSEDGYLQYTLVGSDDDDDEEGGAAGSSGSVSLSDSDGGGGGKHRKHRGGGKGRRSAASSTSMLGRPSKRDNSSVHIELEDDEPSDNEDGDRLRDLSSASEEPDTPGQARKSSHRPSAHGRRPADYDSDLDASLEMLAGDGDANLDDDDDDDDEYKTNAPPPPRHTAASAKRGPGRPRKQPPTTGPAKRGPGRPRKDITASPVRKPGRPAGSRRRAKRHSDSESSASFSLSDRSEDDEDDDDGCSGGAVRRRTSHRGGRKRRPESRSVRQSRYSRSRSRSRSPSRRRSGTHRRQTPHHYRRGRSRSRSRSRSPPAPSSSSSSVSRYASSADLIRATASKGKRKLRGEEADDFLNDYSGDTGSYGGGLEADDFAFDSAAASSASAEAPVSFSPAPAAAEPSLSGGLASTNSFAASGGSASAPAASSASSPPPATSAIPAAAVFAASFRQQLQQPPALSSGGTPAASLSGAGFNVTPPVGSSLPERFHLSLASAALGSPVTAQKLQDKSDWVSTMQQAMVQRESLLEELHAKNLSLQAQLAKLQQQRHMSLEEFTSRADSIANGKVQAVSQSERYWKERAQTAEAQLLQQQTEPTGPAWERVQAEAARLRQEREALRQEVQETKARQLEAEARHERLAKRATRLRDVYRFLTGTDVNPFGPEDSAEASGIDGKVSCEIRNPQDERRLQFTLDIHPDAIDVAFQSFALPAGHPDWINAEIQLARERAPSMLIRLMRLVFDNPAPGAASAAPTAQQQSSQEQRQELERRMELDEQSEV